MSIEGDVVWSGGKSWQRNEGTGHMWDKNWWYSPADSGCIGVLLADLKRSGDFRWLVKNGQLVDGYNDGELVPTRTVKQALDTQWLEPEKRCNQAALEECEAILASLRSVATRLKELEHVYGVGFAGGIEYAIALIERGKHVGSE